MDFLADAYVIGVMVLGVFGYLIVIAIPPTNGTMDKMALALMSCLLSSAIVVQIMGG